MAQIVEYPECKKKKKIRMFAIRVKFWVLSVHESNENQNLHCHQEVVFDDRLSVHLCSCSNSFDFPEECDNLKIRKNSTTTALWGLQNLNPPQAPRWQMCILNLQIHVRRRPAIRNLNLFASCVLISLLFLAPGCRSLYLLNGCNFPNFACHCNMN